MEVPVPHRADIDPERLVPARTLQGPPIEKWPALHEQPARKGRKPKARQR